MNGFANAILSLLLGWIRVIVSQCWKLINSEEGGRTIGFFSQHWKIMLLILCVGGFIIDRFVYLLRWRPYTVWRNKRLRRRREREAVYTDEPEDESDPYEASSPYQGPSAAYDEPGAPYGQAADAYASYQDTAAPYGQAGGVPYAAATPSPYAPPAARFQPRAPQNIPEGTAVYAPARENEQTRVYPQPAAAGSAPTAAYQPYVPPADLSPVFDDDLADWSEGDTLVRPQGLGGVTEGMTGDFGAAKPEPVDYIRDMQAGFAKPLPPEQLYAPPPSPAAAPADPQTPVHPGLDMDNFRRNIGLAPAGPLNQPEEDFHAFAPAWQTDEDELGKASRRNPFAHLAKKARDFVGVNGEDDPRTIHDLQPVVDRRTAFHDPVYPKPRRYKEGDDSSKD